MYECQKEKVVALFSAYGCTHGTPANQISIKIALMQHEVCKKFGEHLKTLRVDKGLSLNLFAYENDLNKSTLSRIENGIVDPKLTTLKKIADGLEIPLNELTNF